MLRCVNRIEAIKPAYKGHSLGGLVVFLSAAFWSFDALFRPYVSVRMDAEAVVFWEHVVACIPILPFIIKYVVKERRSYSWRVWISLLVIAFGADAGASTLLTKGYSLGHVALVSLLQQSQPIFGLIGAHIVLGEELSGKTTYLLITGALFSMGILLYPFAKAASQEEGAIEGLQAGMYGLGAAALWATETVLGRYLMHMSTPLLQPWEVFVWREVIALAFLMIWVQFMTLPPFCVWFAFLGIECNVSEPVIWPARQIIFLVCMSLIELVALAGYLVGLKNCKASIASVMELAHPVLLLTVIPPLLHIMDPENVFHPLEVTQYGGAFLLVLCSGGLGIVGSMHEDAVVPEEKVTNHNAE